MKNNRDNESQFEIFQDEIVEEYLRLTRKIIDDSIKKYISQQNIEKYNDMKVISINTVYESDGKTISYYTYDVQDTVTKEIYEEIKNRSNDTINKGDFVRVYLSDIEYIGFKL